MPRLIQNLLTVRAPRGLGPTMALACPLLLSACGALFGDGSPPPKEQAQLEIQVQASSLINPDDSGRPSPLLVRIYELRNEALFADADFFSLYNNDRTILQSDMLVVDQFILRPGETRSLYRKANPQAHMIGVLAAYRDLPHATWRAIYKLPSARTVHWYTSVLPDEKVQLRIELQSKAASIIDVATGRISEAGASLPNRSVNPVVPDTAEQTSNGNPAQSLASTRTQDVLEHGKSLDKFKNSTPTLAP